MRAFISLLTISWLSATTVAARRPSEVKFFSIWPASRRDDPDRKEAEGFNPCLPTSFDGDSHWNSSSSRWFFDICGDGMYCMYGWCGKFLGKEKMCCSGKGSNSQLGPIINGPGNSLPKLECQDYAKILETYDFEKKGEKPETKGCQKSHYDENYPVGQSGYMEMSEAWRGEKTPKSCCSVEKDAISLYKNETNEYGVIIDKAVCIPPLDDEMPQKGSSKNSAVRLHGVSAVPFVVILASAIGIIHHV